MRWKCRATSGSTTRSFCLITNSLITIWVKWLRTMLNFFRRNFSKTSLRQSYLPSQQQDLSVIIQWSPMRCMCKLIHLCLKLHLLQILTTNSNRNNSFRKQLDPEASTKNLIRPRICLSKTYNFLLNMLLKLLRLFHRSHTHLCSNKWWIIHKQLRISGHHRHL